MIEIRDLCHAFGEKKVLNEINLTLPDCGIVGLVGVNGAGKSTFLRILSGVYVPDRGEVLYGGQSPLDAETRKDIFFLPDDPYYTHRSTATDIFNLYSVFYPNVNKERFENLLSQFHIAANKPIRNFSKGMRRQVFVALALAIEPKYLLLDEAFDGLDPLSRKIFKDAIVDLVEGNGCAVVISSHSLRELEDFCDSFILIDDTRIKHHGSIDDHTARLCKFELAFADAPTEQMFAHLPILSLTLNGRFVKIVLTADAESVMEKLSALNPLVMEEQSVDFEEAFIYDVQSGRGGKNV